MGCVESTGTTGEQAAERDRLMPDQGKRDRLERDQLVTGNIPLVGYIVNEFASRLPAHVDRDDLAGAGMIGLVQAAQAYDDSRGVPFARYASVRIRGSIVDELRARDWATRSVRSRARERDEMMERLTATLGRTPTIHEVADALGIPASRIGEMDDDLHRSIVLRLDAAPDPGAFDSMVVCHDLSPEQRLERREEFGYLGAAVNALPDRLRTVVQMYFLQGKPMADIAALLEVTESRISQMRGEALALLREGMRSQLDPEMVTPAHSGAVDRRRAAYFAELAAHSDFRSRLRPLPEEAAPAATTRLASTA
jgi:RNA polymerase sigma factor FliA